MKFPDTILLNHGTNDLRSEESAEKIVSNIINVALSAKNKNIAVYVSGLAVKMTTVIEREKKLTLF